MSENLDLKFWRRTHRAMRALLMLALIGALVGPSARAIFSSLFQLNLEQYGIVMLLALHGIEVVVALAATIVLARLVSAAETRWGATMLAAAATFAALSGIYESLRVTTALEPLTGIVLPAALAQPIPAAAERALEVLTYIAVAGGLAGIGFVARRWAVLGAPAVVTASAAQVTLLLQGCTRPRMHPLCAMLSGMGPSVRQRLPLVSALFLAISWLLLVVMVSEIIRSIRFVALDDEGKAEPPEEGHNLPCTRIGATGS